MNSAIYRTLVIPACSKCDENAYSCSYSYVLFICGFNDDTPLGWVHRDSKDIFGVRKVADSPLKTCLCVPAHENRLEKQKYSSSFYKHRILKKHLKRIITKDVLR